MKSAKKFIRQGAGNVASVPSQVQSISQNIQQHTMTQPAPSAMTVSAQPTLVAPSAGSIAYNAHGGAAAGHVVSVGIQQASVAPLMMVAPVQPTTVVQASSGLYNMFISICHACMSACMHAI